MKIVNSTNYNTTFIVIEPKDDIRVYFSKDNYEYYSKKINKLIEKALNKQGDK